VTLRDALAGLTTSNVLGSGLAHAGGAQPAGDSQCAQCHNATGNLPIGDIDLNHFPVTPPAAGNALVLNGTNANTNAAWIASGGSVGRLPPGAITVTYDVKSVSRNAAKNPVMVFRMLQNGTAVPLNNPTTSAPNPATGDREIWDNFMGSPSVYFVFSVPQDGIAQPADFNASVSGWLKSIWNAGKTSLAASAVAATLTGPDASGYYTATLTGYTVPDSAVMLTGGLGYTYNVTSTLPLTQTNVAGYPTAVPTVVPALTGAAASFRTGGLIVIAPNAQKVASAGCPVANNNAIQCVLTGSSAGSYIGRRTIVEDARCNACHQELGTFTEDAFHAGQRNDGTTCAWCHTPNRTNSGWSVDSTHFVHAIHASAKRAVPFTYQASASSPAGFSNVTYPGILNDCQTCHLPGTFDFSATASANAVGQGTDQVDKREYRTVGTGTYAAGPSTSPFVQPPYAAALGTAYGSGFSYNTTTGATTEAAPTTLVMSPTVTVCSACHNTADAISHFKINGAAFYQPRSTAITGSNETCLICHGTGRLVDIAVMHAKNR
jgi:OmcA/MtrC family decaheme c-type cytochrome